MQLFLLAEDQWDRGGMTGLPTRFDLLGAEAAWRLHRARHTPALIADVRTIASAALAEIMDQERRRQHQK